MKAKIYIRYFILVIVILTATTLYSYTRSHPPAKDSCAYAEDDQKQSEFIILKSFAYIFLSGQE